LRIAIVEDVGWRRVPAALSTIAIATCTGAPPAAVDTPADCDRALGYADGECASEH
jgi:hypothetical protein